MTHLPGLTFDHGEDITVLLATVQQFGQTEIALHAGEIDRTDQFPMVLWNQMGELDLFSIAVSEEDGGTGTGLGYLVHMRTARRMA